MTTLYLRELGLVSYKPIWRAMQEYSSTRDEHAPDELWLLEHEPVFTLGQAAKPEHVLNPGNIPVVQIDRGGQVTYHGPGQLVAYLLIDIKRRRLGVRDLVDAIERSVLSLLEGYGIKAELKKGAPGVYVDGRKVASLGLRIRRGCSYHGLSLNVYGTDSAFKRINPCGYAGLEVVNLADLVDIAPKQLLQDCQQKLAAIIKDVLAYQELALSSRLIDINHNADC